MTADPDAIAKVNEREMLELAGVPRSTWQSWTRDGLLEVNGDGRYSEAEVLEVAVVARLRRHFSLADVRKVWRALGEAGVVRRLVSRGRRAKAGTFLDLVIEPSTFRGTLATNQERLVDAVRDGASARLVLVVPLGDDLAKVHEGFGNRAEVPKSRPKVVRRGATVTPIRSSASRKDAS